MADQSHNRSQSTFFDILTEGRDDQEFGASHFREKMSTSIHLQKVWSKLSRTEERLLLYLNNTDMPFLESIVGQGLGGHINWVIPKVRMISTMLIAAVERTNSGSASIKELGVLDRFATSISDITRLINGDITDNLISNEVLEFSSPTEVRKYARQFSEKISSIEARVNGLHDWAATLGLMSGEHGATMSMRSDRIAMETVAEEDRTDQLTVGLEEDVQVITSKLIGGQTTRDVIAIVGVKGIGKTTLARKLYHSLEVAHHFPSRAWVTLPLDFDPNAVLVSVAKQVLVGYSENDSMERIRHKLYSLWCFKRYLIVLDDAHVIEDVSKTLHELFPNASNGSRLLITTARMDLLKASPNCYIHEKRPLGDEEAWELFNATLGFKVDAQVEQLAREIVKKRSGIPSFVLEVRDFMSKKAAMQEQWFMIFSQINDAQTSHYLALGSSFQQLPSNARECLLYFILFPQNEIPARRLMVLWVAEGLVDRTADSEETPESAAEKILIELVQRCMIQVANWKPNGKVKTCRMNYHLLDEIFIEEEKENFLCKNLHVAPSKSSSSQPRILRAADHLDNNCPIFSHIHEYDSIGSSSFKHRYGRLISFLSFDSREGPTPGQDLGNFLHRAISLRCLKRVRVIDLEGTFRPKLPDSIRKLTQLRYLGLRRTYTELLPASIGKLSNLQTLDLKHTCLRTLPCSIWKLQQLRHLYLSEMYRSRIVTPGSSSSLLDIQTLWGAFVDEETRFEDGVNRLTNLRKLGLIYQLGLLQQGLLAEWISKLHHLESLRLRSIDDMNQPTLLYLKTISGLSKLYSLYLIGRLANPYVLEALPESLTEITLSFSGLTNDPMRTLEKLPYLRILNLCSASYTKNSMVCSSGGFPLLRVLNLWMLEELEEWTVKYGSLTILKHLEIRSCRNLKAIPEGLKHLANCRELKLTNMHNDFNARVTKDEGIDWYKIAHIPSVVITNKPSPP